MAVRGWGSRRCAAGLVLVVLAATRVCVLAQNMPDCSPCRCLQTGFPPEPVSFKMLCDEQLPAVVRFHRNLSTFNIQYLELVDVNVSALDATAIAPFGGGVRDIGGRGLTEFPLVVAALPNVTVVTFRESQMSTLPCLTFTPKLEILRLVNIGVSHLPKCFLSSIHNVHDLSFNGRLFSSRLLSVESGVLSTLTKLELFSFVSHIQLTELPEDFLDPAIHTRLRHVALSSTSLFRGQSQATRWIERHDFSRYPLLERLDCNACNLEVLPKLPPSIQHLRGIANGDGLRHIPDGHINAFPNLQELSIGSLHVECTKLLEGTLNCSRCPPGYRGAAQGYCAPPPASEVCRRTGTVVNCSNTKEHPYTLAYPPALLPSDTILDLIDVDTITHLDRSFWVGADRLQNLNLRGTSIVELSNRPFDNIRNTVNELIFSRFTAFDSLDQNRLINRIQEDTFTTLPSLKALYFFGQRFANFSGAILDLPNLKVLSIGAADPKSFNEETLCCLPGLEEFQAQFSSGQTPVLKPGLMNVPSIDSLRLEFNQFQAIQDGFFAQFPRLSYVEMSDSPGIIFCHVVRGQVQCRCPTPLVGGDQGFCDHECPASFKRDGIVGECTPATPALGGASSCQASCDFGYAPMGDPTLSCFPGGLWDGGFACVPIACPISELASTLDFFELAPGCISGNLTTGDCRPRCVDGTASEGLFRCRSDGTWIAELTTCVPLPSTSSGPSAVPIVAGAVVAGVVVLVALVALVVLLQRRRRAGEQAKIMPLAPRMSLMEAMHQDYGALLSPAEAGRAAEGFQDLEIARQNIFLENELGSGAFGVVCKARLMAVADHPVEAAVKRMQASASEQEQLRFLAEARLQASLQHPGLVRVLGVCSVRRPYWICLELMAGGDLKGYLEDLQAGQRPHEEVSPAVIVDMATQLADAMAYLESRAIVHRDLAARNVLVGESLRNIKVADMGMSRRLDGDYYRSKSGHERVPVKWMSPECLSDLKFTHKSDVWAFGVCVWEMTSMGANPHEGMSGAMCIRAVISGHRLPRTPLCSEALYQVLLKCWAAEPSGRPSFIIAHHDLQVLKNVEQPALPFGVESGASGAGMGFSRGSLSQSSGGSQRGSNTSEQRVRLAAQAMRQQLNKPVVFEGAEESGMSFNPSFQVPATDGPGPAVPKVELDLSDDEIEL